ncbi:helix-turn-helix domain-containing protein [Streptomyces jumonjinensis]|uniref:helix-turn-helix domain-containing protein n=1 Tax=Streptomyces jumonjinensis TaxID=1945 RepID=UPI0037B02EFF
MPPRKSQYGHRTARQILADELAQLREQSGKTLSTLSEDTTYDRSYLHRLENGTAVGSPEVMAALDRVYGTGRELQLLWEVAKNDAFADKYKRFMALERRATVRYQYSCGTVPGLLQTEAYAREVLKVGRPRDEHALEEQVVARLSRQSILRQEDAPHFRALLDEAVLRRPATDPKVWRDQLGALLEATELPNVTLQVVPFSIGLHDLLGGSLTILWLPNGTAVAYMESSKSGELVEDPGDVEAFRLSYDLLRDSAMSPRESTSLIQQLMEDSALCDPPDPT